MLGATFEADEPTIFGELNHDYIDRELAWYKSKSLNVNDIPGKTPAIWQQVADANGFINSNYGWAIWHEDNYNQYYRTYQELSQNPNSRRAVMIYTRPNMWLDYNHNGRSDFMCTNTVQYMIRDGVLIAVVQMRSNDVVFGYRNDFAWQDHVVKLLASALGIEQTKIIWHVGNLHVYERHFDKVK
jgi:thymidylate synthase